jgi:ligand-binding sensor domain-containing protein
VQEYHLAHFVSEEPGANDVRAIAVDDDDTVWAGTAAGLYMLEKGKSGWRERGEEFEAGPVFDVMVDSIGTVWIGAWNGVFRASPLGLKEVPGIGHPISALCEDRKGSIVCLGPDGMWKIEGEDTTSHPLPCSRNIRGAIPGQCGDLWIATGMGLYHHTPDGDRLYQQNDEILTADLEDVAFAADGKLWAGGFGGVSVYNEGHLERLIRPADGLPTVNVQSVALGPDNTMWVGTSHGVARYDG